MPNTRISIQALRRMPMYLSYLRTLDHSKTPNISATSIADELELNHVQVRKDLASVSSGGKPKIGYNTRRLIADIEVFLGCGRQVGAVIVGAGRLGSALLTYSGFAGYGLNVMAGFDTDEKKTGIALAGKQIYHTDVLCRFCQTHNIQIGIITVPAPHAQEACDMLVKAGVSAIWNFAPIHLSVPEGMILHNENMAASLAVLSNQLSDKDARK